MSTCNKRITHIQLPFHITLYGKEPPPDLLDGPQNIVLVWLTSYETEACVKSLAIGKLTTGDKMVAT